MEPIPALDPQRVKFKPPQGLVHIKTVPLPKLAKVKLAHIPVVKDGKAPKTKPVYGMTLPDRSIDVPGSVF